MPLRFIRLISFGLVTLFNMGLTHSQVIDNLDLPQLLQKQDTLRIAPQLKELSMAKDSYFCADYIENYLNIKYDIFESLVNKNLIKEAYRLAEFDDITLSYLQENTPIILTEYYDKILSYSIRNKHFVSMKVLALRSLHHLNVNTRNDSIYLFSNFRQVGLTHRYLAEYDISFKYLHDALDLGLAIYGKDQLDVASAHYNIGVNHAIRGEFNDALEYILASKKIKLTHFSEGDIAFSHEYNALGLVYESLGEYDLALEYHNRAIDLKKAKSKNFTLNLGRSYMNLGTLLLTMGQPQLAYQKSKYALDELENITTKDVEMKIWLHNNIGRSLIAMDRPSEAIEYLKIGLLKNENKFDLSIDASLEENLGIALMKSESYNKAIEYLSSSQEKFIKDSPEHQRLSNLDIALSQCHFGQKQYTKAEQYAINSLDRLQRKLAKKHPLLFQPYYQLAKIYHEVKDYDKSTFFITKIDSLSNISSLNQLKANNLKLEIYQEIDQSAFALQKTEGYNHISESLKGYIPTEERYLLSKEVKRFYNLSLRNWEASEDQKNVEELINIFNNSKNTMLQAKVLSNQVNTFTDIPEDFTNRERSLAKNIRYLENTSVYNYQSLDQFTSKQNIENLENTQIQYSQLLDSIELYYPKYFNLKYVNSNIELNQLLKSIDETTAILDFFKGEKHLYILTIYKGEVKLTKKPIDDIWNQELLKFKNSLTDNNTILDESKFDNVYDQFVSKSPAIYNYLLKEPIQQLGSSVNSLVIIPDGILNFIPFETLLQSDKNAKSSDYRKLDYLINSYNISYSYSLSLINNQYNNKSRHGINYMGFAPQYKNSDNSEDLETPLSDLPSARKSVVSSSELFNGKSYISDEATKAKFASTASKSSILHLAMHCVIDNDNPMDTKLVFGSERKDELDYLKASDLYNLQLNNQLSVLTACNTGVGNIREGEGVISLSRAFTYAGSESLMMSLWSVPDAQSAHVTNYFFENIKSGNRKDISLKNAKIKYLSESPRSTSHPMFWAGFIISGNTESIRLNHNFNPTYLLFVLIGPVLVFFYRRHRVNAKNK